MSADGRRILYISYDGMTDPLGRSQVLPYLAGLAQRGHAITILSAEKADRFASDRGAVEALCRASGLNWQPLRYHRRPSIVSSAYDLLQLRRKAAQLHRARPFDIVHCRSYIPAIAGLWLKRRFGIAFVFDMRGFWPEEKVEGGSWPLSNPLFRAIYGYFKRCESELLSEADSIVSLTEAARDELETRPELGGRGSRISVIPCCVDLDHFRIQEGARVRIRAALGLDAERPLLVYLGSLSGNYMLDEMLDFFLALRERKPDAAFLFITRDDAERIRSAAAKKGIGPEALLIRPASREEVPDLIAAADLGVAFKRPTFSALACSPTKLGEMLAIGIPVAANAGVGDVAAVLAKSTAGSLVDRFDHPSLLRAVDATLALGSSRERIREISYQRFALKGGIDRYDAIYRSLSAGRTPFPPLRSVSDPATRSGAPRAF